MAAHLSNNCLQVPQLMMAVVITCVVVFLTVMIICNGNNYLQCLQCQLFTAAVTVL